MVFLKKLFKFYVFSNLHVALAGFCLTRIIEYRLGLRIGFTPYFIAFSIVLSYNYIRLYEVKTNRLGWLKAWFKEQQKYLTGLSFLSFIGILYLILSKKVVFNALLVLIPFAFTTLFYVVPLLKIGKKEISFRNFPGVKIFSIALTWAGVTVFFPLVNEGGEISNTIWLFFLQQFFFLIAYTIPFDIRDVNVDDKQLKTLPQVFGVFKTKLIGLVCVFLFLIIEYFNSKFISFNVLIINLLLLIFIVFSSPKLNRYYTSFWVEAIPIIWLFLIVLL